MIARLHVCDPLGPATRATRSCSTECSSQSLNTNGLAWFTANNFSPRSPAAPYLSKLVMICSEFGFNLTGTSIVVEKQT
jgi:hypothetical protein